MGHPVAPGKAAHVTFAGPFLQGRFVRRRPRAQRLEPTVVLFQGCFATQHDGIDVGEEALHLQQEMPVRVDVLCQVVGKVGARVEGVHATLARR